MGGGLGFFDSVLFLAFSGGLGCGRCGDVEHAGSPIWRDMRWLRSLRELIAEGLVRQGEVVLFGDCSGAPTSAVGLT